MRMAYTRGTTLLHYLRKRTGVIGFSAGRIVAMWNLVTVFIIILILVRWYQASGRIIHECNGKIRSYNQQRASNSVDHRLQKYFRILQFHGSFLHPFLEVCTNTVQFIQVRLSLALFRLQQAVIFQEGQRYCDIKQHQNNADGPEHKGLLVFYLCQ